MSSASGPSERPALNLSDFDETPLFMTSLPEADAISDSNDTIEALRSLVYDGSPEGGASSSVASTTNSLMLLQKLRAR